MQFIDECVRLNIFRWKHKGSSNMAVLEVSMLTGFKADIESLEKLLQRRHLKLKRYEIDGRKIVFYFDEVHSNIF